MIDRFLIVCRSAFAAGSVASVISGGVLPGFSLTDNSSGDQAVVASMPGESPPFSAVASVRRVASYRAFWCESSRQSLAAVTSLSSCCEDSECSPVWKVRKKLIR